MRQAGADAAGAEGGASRSLAGWMKEAAASADPAPSAEARALARSLLVIASAVDREGRVWPRRAPARAAVEAATREFDRAYLLPFALRRQLSPRGRAELRRELMCGCGQLIASAGDSVYAVACALPEAVAELLTFADLLPATWRFALDGGSSVPAGTPPPAFCSLLLQHLDLEPRAEALRALAAGRAAEDREIAERSAALLSCLRAAPDFALLMPSLEPAIWRWGSAASELFHCAASAPPLGVWSVHAAEDAEGRPILLEVSFPPPESWPEAAARFLLQEARASRMFAPACGFACSVGELELCRAFPETMSRTSRWEILEVPPPHVHYRISERSPIDQRPFAAKVSAVMSQGDAFVASMVENLASVEGELGAERSNGNPLAPRTVEEIVEVSPLQVHMLSERSSIDQQPFADKVSAAMSRGDEFVVSMIGNLASVEGELGAERSNGNPLASRTVESVSPSAVLGAILRRLERLVGLLVRLAAATAVLGPAPREWERISPYRDLYLRMLGLAPMSSLAEAEELTALSRSPVLAEVRTLESRLEHDAFLYRLADGERLLAYRRQMLDDPLFALLRGVSFTAVAPAVAAAASRALEPLSAPATLADALGEDAVVVLAALGDIERAIEVGEQLAARGVGGWLHHNLALLYLRQSEDLLCAR